MKGSLPGLKNLLVILIFVLQCVRGQCDLDLFILHYAGSEAAEDTVLLWNALPVILRSTLTQYPGVRFALGTYSVKSCGTAGDAPGCFTLNQGFTEDADTLMTAARGVVPSGGLTVTPLWDALVLTALSDSITWRASSSTPTPKVVVMTGSIKGIADTETEYFCGSESFPTDLDALDAWITLNGKDTMCESLEYAMWDIAKLVYQRAGISLGIVTNSSTLDVVLQADKMFSWVLSPHSTDGAFNSEMGIKTSLYRKVDWTNWQSLKDAIGEIVHEVAKASGCQALPDDDDDNVSQVLVYSGKDIGVVIGVVCGILVAFALFVLAMYYLVFRSHDISREN